MKINLLLLPDRDHSITEYSRGHITLKNENIVISSLGQVPDQSMMLCLAIVELLDGVSLLMNRTQTIYKFVGTDSSFQFTIQTISGKRFQISAYGNRTYDIEIEDFARKLREQVKVLLSEYTTNQVTGSCIDDLHLAFEQFDHIYAKLNP